MESDPPTLPDAFGTHRVLVVRTVAALVTTARFRCWCRRFGFGWNGGFRCGACVGLGLMLLFALTADSIREHNEAKANATREHERIANDPRALVDDWIEWRLRTRDQPWALENDRASLDRYREVIYPQSHPRYWDASTAENIRLVLGLFLYAALLFGAFYPSPVHWRTPARKLPGHPKR